LILPDLDAIYTVDVVPTQDCTLTLSTDWDIDLQLADLPTLG
jgi:hypothetical protein